MLHDFFKVQHQIIQKDVFKKANPQNILALSKPKLVGHNVKCHFKLRFYELKQNPNRQQNISKIIFQNFAQQVLFIDEMLKVVQQLAQQKGTFKLPFYFWTSKS